jgi:hypothetical protein
MLGRTLRGSPPTSTVNMAVLNTLDGTDKTRVRIAVELPIDMWRVGFYSKGRLFRDVANQLAAITPSVTKATGAATPGRRCHWTMVASPPRRVSARSSRTAALTKLGVPAKELSCGHLEHLGDVKEPLIQQTTSATFNVDEHVACDT